MASTGKPISPPAGGFASPVQDSQRLSMILAAAILILAAALPLALSSYQIGLATEVLIFGILAMSIDLLAGFAGRTSLGHGAIFGISTYVVVYASEQAGCSPLLAVALGVTTSTAAAAVF